MCDDAGSVYARQIDKTPVDPLELMLGSIQQITSDGKLAGTFQVTRALPGGAQSRTFSIHDGKAYLLAGSTQKGGGLDVVEFATDGSTRTRAKIGVDDLVDVLHLAVNKSGESLLVGLTGKNLQTPYTAVFSADGRLVKKMVEPEDEVARPQAELGDPQYSSCCTGSGNKFILDDVDLAAGSDGTVYLLHGASCPLIYLISPDGDVVRKLRIDAEDPDLKQTASSFMRAGSPSDSVGRAVSPRA
jgi:hypothetical protein